VSQEITVKNLDAIRAQGHIHHGFLLGLQLMVASRRGPELIEQWMFALFRRQHHEKFLSSFAKLGLSTEPDAVACAKYHVLSNAIGGVPVEYIAESDNKAWVRFRYPRWMYHGATLCGLPDGVGRGFMRGWYAHNGVSLNNPRLGFVCVSEDMTGEFGFCGYFKEFDHDLPEEERLQFSKSELPPPFRAEDQPLAPAAHWSDERLAKANRNYALEYIRNGLGELTQLLGEDETRALAGQAARLIGLQYYAETAVLLGAIDGSILDAGHYLAAMFRGMGDTVELLSGDQQQQVQLQHNGLRIVRGIEGSERRLLLACWHQLWLGAMRSQQLILNLEMEQTGPDTLLWTITQCRR